MGLKTSLRNLCLLSKIRHNGILSASGYWNPYAGIHVHTYGIADDIGLLFGSLFTSMVRPAPDLTQYVNLLAAGDTLYQFWIDNPRANSKCGALILTVLCNAIGLITIRFMAITGGTNRYQASRLTAALDTAAKEFIFRPERSLQLNRLEDVSQFLEKQLEGTTGSTATNAHLVYLMLAGNKPYVGRASVTRTSLSSILPGIPLRWSEHVRELQQHLDGSIDRHRQRRRYQIRRTQQPSSCLDYLILDICSHEDINMREAVAIARTQPAANGKEFKHLSELFHKKRDKPTKHRNRTSHSSRRTARRKEIRMKEQQWGKDIKTHARQLDAASERNLINNHQSYSRSITNIQQLRDEFSLTFKELYRREQTQLGKPGPIYLYGTVNVFIR